MTAPDKSSPTLDRELVLTRIIDAPCEKVFRAWTEPELLKQWFAPLPWTTPVAELVAPREARDLGIGRVS
jgi:uncharacterized protein YndB with AHSA1/START domain